MPQPQAGTGTGQAARTLLPRTLRARLTCGLVVLLALSCAAVGIAAVLGLRAFLTDRVDQQLGAAGGRFPASLEHAGGTGGTGGREPDADNTHVDTRSQAPGTFGARLLHGRITGAAVVRAGADTSVQLSAADRRAIAALSADGRCRGLDLSALGDYRVSAMAGDDGDVLVIGMPMSGVEQAEKRLIAVEAAVFGGALLVAGAAGAFWVRWSLRPLRRVAATATAVTALPLDSGAVALPDRVPDTDPRTEVGQVGAALNRMLGHVEGALSKRQASQERLRSFAADASHELRTPVAAIRGHAELALRHPGPVPEGVGRSLERIVAESTRMGAMVDDLLLLARLDAGRPLAREPVDLTRLVLDAVDDARAAGPGHRWTLDLPEEPVTVTGDGPRLHQLLANLLANARVHTPQGTRVTVRLRQDAHTTVLAVSDDGPGIPEPLRATVFQRFSSHLAAGRTSHRDPRRPSDSGAGLGLSIVTAVAAAHGGEAALAVRPGETAFTVTLPGRTAQPD